MWQRLTLKPLDWDLDNTTAVRIIIQQLLKHKDSPWRKIDWETPLDKPKENDFFATVTKHYFAQQEPEDVSRDDNFSTKA